MMLTESVALPLLASAAFTSNGDAEVVSVTGEVDLSNASDLATLVSGRIRVQCRLVVDLTELRSIDSAGVRALVGLQSQIAGDSGRLAIAVGRATTVRRVLALGGALEVVPVFASVTRAVAWVTDPSSPD
jgi:anti-sigma B factor antagonist